MLTGLALPAHAADYFVDATAGDDAQTGAQDHPWKSLARVEQQVLAAGDKVSFMAGRQFTGSLVLAGSGTADAPIILTSYGTGEAPVLRNPDAMVHNGNVIRVTGSYVIIEKLHFHQTVTELPGTPNATDDTYVKQSGAVFVAVGAQHVTVRNCEMTDTPLGIQSHGAYTLITGNRIHDCNRFLDSPNWGPIGVMVASANHEISYNLIQNMKVIGGRFGADGGALELDNTPLERTNISIHHNLSLGNEGFLEVSPTGRVSNVNVSYNISADFQNFIFFWACVNCTADNNTVLRHLPPNGGDNVVFTFGNNVAMGNKIRNNIFVVANGLKVFAITGRLSTSANFAQQTHDHNIIFGLGASTADPAGGPLGDGDVIADPRFVDFSGGDLRLLPTSPAVDNAAPLGYTMDFFDNVVPHGGAPDIGAIELDDCLAAKPPAMCAVVEPPGRPKGGWPVDSGPPGAPYDAGPPGDSGRVDMGTTGRDAGGAGGTGDDSGTGDDTGPGGTEDDAGGGGGEGGEGGEIDAGPVIQQLSGGCGCATAGDAAPAGWVVTLLLMATLAVRRRRTPAPIRTPRRG